MEQLTARPAPPDRRGAAAARGAAGDAGAAAAPLRPRGAAAQGRDARCGWRGSASALAALLLTVVLAHQMWLVLSVGELTGVEQVMLVLFVINIAWVCFGALSPLMGFFLGRGRRRATAGAAEAAHGAADADLQRGSGARSSAPPAR